MTTTITYKHRESLQKLFKKDLNEYIEKTFGKDHDKNPIAVILKTMFLQQHDEYINQILMMNEDTVLADEVKRYIPIAIKLGFDPTVSYEFTGLVKNEPTKETIDILWDKKNGILLKVESFNTIYVKKAQLFFNWQPNNSGEYNPDIMQDGHYTPNGIWIGEHDVAVALKYKFILLQENGTFINPWIKTPYMSFKGYSENKKGDEITHQRIQQLPKAILKQINA